MLEQRAHPLGRAGRSREIDYAPIVRRVRRAFALTVVCSVCAAGPAGADIADNDPAEIVSYRQLVMKSFDLHMDGISAPIEGRIDYWGHVKAHAEAIERMSWDMLEIFPHWTGPKATKTQALPAIWRNWQEFKTVAAELEQEAKMLVETVDSIDRRAIQFQFSRVRRTCDGCHLKFTKSE